jgi:DNA repair exonuclease SbcCD nuclease subunit
MRIAIVSDLHIGYERFRKDAYEQAKQALTMAAQRADAIIIPGDIFDTRFPKPDVIAEAINIFRELPKDRLGARIVEFNGVGKVYTDKPVLAIPGTHERRTSDVEDPVDLLNLTSLLADIGMGVAVLEKDGEKVAVTGIAGVVEERFGDALKEHASKTVGGAFNILMFHQSLYELLPFNDSFLRMEQLPEGFDLYVNGHIHSRFESNVHGKPFLIPGSTVLTQLKDGETDRKGFFVYDTLAKTYEYIHIESRGFESIKIDVDSADESALLRSMEEKINDAVLKHGQGCVIRIEINGNGKEVKKAGIGIQEIVKRFKNDAVIEIAKKGFESVSDDEKRTEISSDINNASVKDLGIGILMSELKKNGYDLGIGPAELFERLSSGEKKEKVLSDMMSELLS